MRKIAKNAFWVLLLVTFFLSLGYVNSVLADEGGSDNTTESSDDSEAVFDDGDSEEGFDEEDGDGFETVSVNMDEIKSSSGERELFVISGFVKEDLAYSHTWEEPDLSKIRTILNLTLDLDLSAEWKAKLNWNGFYDYAYSHIGRDSFTDETLESSETESEVRDLYLDGSPATWLNLRFGRQIIAWGESEAMQVTDMANPRDMRELGMVDIEDARLAVAATKLSLLLDSWQINFAAIHEIRGNKMAGAGSEFDALRGIRTVFTVEDEEVPESETSNTEYLLRIFKSFNGGDVGLVWADVYEDAFYLELTRIQLSGAQPQLSMTPRHNRIQSVGLSGNIVSGSWLFKAEAAKKSKVALARNFTDIQVQLQQALPELQATAITSGNPNISEKDIPIEVWDEKAVQQLVLGLEYQGLEDLSLSLEVGAEQIVDYEENLRSKEVTTQAALMLTYTALNDTLDVQLFWIHFTDDNGEVVRVNLGYDLIDALTVSGGFIIYEASNAEAIVYSLRNSDRLFAAVKYSF